METNIQIITILLALFLVLSLITIYQMWKKFHEFQNALLDKINEHSIKYLNILNTLFESHEKKIDGYIKLSTDLLETSNNNDTDYIKELNRYIDSSNKQLNNFLHTMLTDNLSHMNTLREIIQNGLKDLKDISESGFQKIDNSLKETIDVE